MSANQNPEVGPEEREITAAMNRIADNLDRLAHRLNRLNPIIGAPREAIADPLHEPHCQLAVTLEMYSRLRLLYIC